MATTKTKTIQVMWDEANRGYYGLYGKKAIRPTRGVKAYANIDSVRRNTRKWMEARNIAAKFRYDLSQLA